MDWLMEAAGWQAARACRPHTTVVCGAGNNAGDGLAAARHLYRWDRLERVSCIDTGRLTGEARAELDVLERLGIDVSGELHLDKAEGVLDALFGTGLNRAPEGRYAEWIESINRAGLRVVAVDLPSGLDADTGVAYAPCVRADVTITFTLPKAGLLKQDGPRQSGEIWVADIGVPFEAIATLGIGVPVGLFDADDVVWMNKP